MMGAVASCQSSEKQCYQAKNLTPGAFVGHPKSNWPEEFISSSPAKAIEVRLYFCSSQGRPWRRHDRCGCFHIKIYKILAKSKLFFCKKW